MKKTVFSRFLKKTTAFLLTLVMSVSLALGASARPRDAFEDVYSGVIVGDVLLDGYDATAVLQLFAQKSPTFGNHVYYILNNGPGALRGYYDVFVSGPFNPSNTAKFTSLTDAKANVFEQVKYEYKKDDNGNGVEVPFDGLVDDPDLAIANAIRAAIPSSALTEIVKTKGATGTITSEVKAAVGASAWQTAWDAAAVTVTAYTAATVDAAGSYTVTVTVNGKTATIPGTIEKLPDTATQAGAARAAIEAKAYTAVSIPWDTDAATTLTAAITAVTTQVNAVAVTDATVGVITWKNAAPTITSAGLAAAGYDFTVAIAGATDTSTETATVSVNITFAATAVKSITLGAQSGTVRSDTKVDTAIFTVKTQNITAGATLAVTVKNSAGTDVTSDFTIGGITLNSNGETTISIADKTSPLPVGAYTVTVAYEGATPQTATLTIISNETFKLAGFNFTDANGGAPVSAVAGSHKVDKTAFNAATTEFTVGTEHEVTFNTISGKEYTAVYKPTVKPATNTTTADLPAGVSGYYIKKFSFVDNQFPPHPIPGITGDEATIKIGKDGFKKFTDGLADATKFEEGTAAEPKEYIITFSVTDNITKLTKNYTAKYTGKLADAGGNSVQVEATKVNGDMYAVAEFEFVDEDGDEIPGAPTYIKVDGQPHDSTAEIFTDGGEYEITFITAIKGVTIEYSGTYTGDEDDAGSLAAIQVTAGPTDSKTSYTVTDIAASFGGAPLSSTSDIKVGTAKFVAAGSPGATKFAVGQNGYEISFINTDANVMTNYTGTYNGNAADATTTKVATFTAVPVPNTARYTLAFDVFDFKGNGDVDVSNVTNVKVDGREFVDSSGLGHVDGKTGLDPTEFFVNTGYKITFTGTYTDANGQTAIADFTAAVANYTATAADAAAINGEIEVTGTGNYSGKRFTRTVALKFRNGQNPNSGEIDASNIKNVWVGGKQLTLSPKGPNPGDPDPTEFTVGESYDVTFTLSNTDIPAIITTPGEVWLYKAPYSPQAVEPADVTTLWPATRENGNWFHISNIAFRSGESLTAPLLTPEVDKFEIIGGMYAEKTEFTPATADTIVFEADQGYTITFSHNTAGTGANAIITAYKISFTANIASRNEVLSLVAAEDTTVKKQFRVATIALKDAGDKLNPITATTANSNKMIIVGGKYKASDATEFKSGANGTLLEVGVAYTVTFYKETGPTTNATTLASILTPYYADILAADTGIEKSNGTLELRAYADNTKPKQFKVGSLTFVNNDGNEPVTPTTVKAFGKGLDNNGTTLALASLAQYFIDGEKYVFTFTATEDYASATDWTANVTTDANKVVKVVVDEVQ